MPDLSDLESTPLPKSFPKQFKRIINNCSLNPNEERIKFLYKAYLFAENAHKKQKRSSGEPYFVHCVEVAVTLSKWCMDIDTVIAGLLHDTIEDTDVTKEEIRKEFNKNISELVDGVSKLSGIKFHSRQKKQAENFMKLFLSVANDIRVIIVKFADRLHNMRTLNHLPLIKQHRIAVETRDVYAPLAHRLGMGALKSELEDIVLKTVDPKGFKEISKQLKTSRSKLDKYIKEFSSPIKKTINNTDIKYEIYGRSKHFYSIHKKMKSRGKEFDEIFDILAIRVVVDKIEECYAVLGIIHQIYKPHQETLKDYIATPKINGYQSIHTTVVGPDGRMVEAQIRTREMDHTAEVGVAAHWSYKDHGSVNAKDSKINRQIKWLRELVELLQNEENDPDEFLNLLKIDLFQEEIFVFTPRGDLTQLNVDSTPVDFAFEVHSEVGAHCIGAKVNSKIVPLNTKLLNGDTVEIITSKMQTPSYAWLKFVKSSKAKYHIKKWVKKEQFEQSLKLGKEITEKTLRRMKKMYILEDMKKNPQLMGFNTQDLIFSELGKGLITVREIVEKYNPTEEGEEEQIDSTTLTSRFLESARGRAKGVIIDGIENTMLTFGKCCNPIPGDIIVGYITRGRGVTIHQSTCTNIPILENEDRFINVEWNVGKNEEFIVRLKIVGEDRRHFLKHISESISGMNVNIVSVDMRTDSAIATGIFVLMVRDTKQLIKIKNRIKLIPDLIYLERI
jgi:GTP diphosphokinase / guanosine-3',5'-bis(diphosphate) 3'-diphosphatase